MVPMEASCSTATICDDPVWVAPRIRATPHDGNPAFDAAIEDEFPGSLIEIDAADGLMESAPSASSLNSPLPKLFLRIVPLPSSSILRYAAFRQRGPSGMTAVPSRTSRR